MRDEMVVSRLLARGAAMLSVGAMALSGLGTERAYADSPGDQAKPAASASAKQVPTVTEQMVRQLFEDLTLYGADVMRANDKIAQGKPTIYSVGTDPVESEHFAGNFTEWKTAFPSSFRNYDPDLFLRDRYRTAKTDEERATIVAFKAYGGIALAGEATVEAYQVCHKIDLYETAPTSILDKTQPAGMYRGETMYTLNIGTFTEVTRKWENRLYSDGTTFVADIAKGANILLSGAYTKHGMNFKTYMSEIYIPYKGPPAPTAATAAIQKAAVALGFRYNADTPKNRELASRIYAAGVALGPDPQDKPEMKALLGQVHEGQYDVALTTLVSAAIDSTNKKVEGSTVLSDSCWAEIVSHLEADLAEKGSEESELAYLKRDYDRMKRVYANDSSILSMYFFKVRQAALDIWLAH